MTVSGWGWGAVRRKVTGQWVWAQGNDALTQQDDEPERWAIPLEALKCGGSILSPNKG